MTLLDLNSADLASDPDALFAVKRPIPVTVRFAAEAGAIDTLEGRVAYDAGAAIVKGVKGEFWPIPAARFKTLYEPLAGTEPGRDGIYRKKPVRVRAKRISEGPFSVQVGARHQTITGRAGDWLIQYSRAKRSIISDEVFRTSYEVISPAATSESRRR